MFKKILTSNKGQALVEYLILLGLFAVILMMTTSLALKHGFSGAFNTYKSVLGGPYKY